LEIIRCETLEDLRETLSRVGPDALFRGQTRHFMRADGTPSLTTSFSRQGCVPELMIKWLYYACSILRRYVQGRTVDPDEPDLATDQAILQHYGWRSFFLDATGDASVAAWFASNQFVSKKSINLMEDCFEDPVILVTEAASFEPAEGLGYIYILSRKKLRNSGIDAVHLSEIATLQGSPRYLRQDAYMVGPVDPKGLNIEFITARIVAPATVLASFAGSHSIEYLFPPPSDDPILKELLSMPWERIENPEAGIGIYRRSLAIPEYGFHLRKHMPATSAMYRRFWLKDIPRNPEENEIIFHILCGGALYHGSSPLSYSLPSLTKLLEVCDAAIIEPPSLVYHNSGTRYGKGVIVRKKSENLVSVGEFGVEHPGLQVTDFGEFPGLHYRINDRGEWSRSIHAEDCPCGSEHNDHIRLLGRVNAELAGGSIKHVGGAVYAEEGLDLSSDPTILNEIVAG
jgi:hypothetical protein